MKGTALTFPLSKGFAKRWRAGETLGRGFSCVFSLPLFPFSSSELLLVVYSQSCSFFSQAIIYLPLLLRPPPYCSLACENEGMDPLLPATQPTKLGQDGLEGPKNMYE
jgi:hypothetical protein